MGKFEEAKKMYPKQLSAFEFLDDSLPDEMTILWNSMPTGPTLGRNGKWTSPFQSSDYAGMSLIICVNRHNDRWLLGVTFQEVLHAERKEEQEGSQEPSRRAGLIRWLSSAIELENTM